MVSFHRKLAEGLAGRAIAVSHDLRDFPYQAVLVIGGTRDLAGLLQARKRGIPVIQRLDGMNWLHRLSGIRQAGWRHYLRAESGNLLLALIRARLASRIVYQSAFARLWWERRHGSARVKDVVIHNGVDLNLFNSQGEERPPEDRWRVLMVEGSLMGGYEQGLSVAMQLAGRLGELLAEHPRSFVPAIVELMVVGRVPVSLRNQWEDDVRHSQQKPRIALNWVGQVPHVQIPSIDRSAHLFYSADINPACPNAVIEALACGLPVAAFDTGALPELVTDNSGRLAPYGSDPWRLETPDVEKLAHSALEILNDLDSFRSAARRRAEAAFGLDRMVDAYLNALLGN
jgi:glycosyltransferase involved in cell wall biosynthesis